MGVMESRKLTQSADPKRLGDYLAGRPTSAHHGGKSHEGSATSIRQEAYEGHSIVIHTAYTIEVDGRKIRAPLSVDNAGQVHCHSLPNYQTASAVGMVKALINNFPDEFVKSRKRPKRKRARSKGMHRNH